MKTFTSEQINLFFPICGVTCYPGGVVVKRSCLMNQEKIRHIHKRGEVLLLSKRSLNRLAILVRSCGVTFTSVMTLTYGQNYPHDGRIAKRHLNTFLVAARRAWGSFEYFWVLEFQHRGAVHFHLATTLPEPDIIQRAQLAQIWTRISVEGDWPYSGLEWDGRAFRRTDLLYTSHSCYRVHVHPGAWEKVRSDDGMGRYLAKYANKLRQKQVPVWYRNVGRFWGTSKGVKMPEGASLDGDEEHLRQILWLRGRDVQKWSVLPKIVLC